MNSRTLVFVTVLPNSLLACHSDGSFPLPGDDPTPDAFSPPDAFPPPGDAPSSYDGILEVTWEFDSHYAGNTIHPSCDALLDTDTIRIIATPVEGALGEPIVRDFSCTDYWAVTTMPVGVYRVVAQARSGATVILQSGGGTPGGSKVEVSASRAFAWFSFEVTTSLEPYCRQLANVVCDTCFPGSGSDSNCMTTYTNAVCVIGGDWYGNHPAIVHPERFPQCLTEWASGNYCSGTGPAVCQSTIAVF
jgi:hypothetical protein